LNSSDLELIRAVAEDLIYLKNDWDESIKDASLRRSSNVLRMLIVDKNFSKAWRTAGFEKEPKVQAPIIEESSIFNDLQEVSFAQAGGGAFSGIQIEGVQIINKALNTKEIQALYQKEKNLKTEKEALGITKFAESNCIIINGTPIKRRELIKYIANKKGGTHIDSKRNENDKEDEKFILLDSLTFTTANKDSIYFELLSIGQCLAKSKDTDKFIKKAKSIVQLDD